MENLSHNKLKLPKRTTSHNAVATNSGPLHKSIYDDVFGGPPKMGVPTFLSPRVEDYGEIFGGFHAPRASGIPVLDLPVMEEDEVGIGNGRLDYKEVFGGFTGLDFANGYEELVRELSHGSADFSDVDEDDDDEVDEAWTPAGSSDCLSEVSDHSGSNQCVSNGGSGRSSDGNIEYNIYYHKSNPGSDMDTANGIMQTAPAHAVPGFSYVVDRSNPFQKSGKENLASQRPDYDNPEMDYGHETIKRKHLRKTTSHPAYGNVYGQEYGIDIRPQREYGRINSLPNETFVTITEVNLRTDPTHLPPPSRPPPALDGKGGDGGRLVSKWKAELPEESKYENLPAFFDVEVDVGSSAAASASAAAMKEAMEKAQAKIKSAKELMERKKEGLHAQTKEAFTNDFIDIGGNGNKIASGTKSVSNEDVTQGLGPIESNGLRNPCTDETRRATKTKLGNLDNGGESMSKDLKGPSEGVRGKHLSSSQIFGDYEEADEWKEAFQFFELVKADKLRGPAELGKKEKIILQNGKESHSGKEGIVSRETFDRQEYDYTTKATSSHGAERIGEKENSECTNKGRLKEVKVASKQKQDDMVHKILEPEETGKKFKAPSSPRGIHEKLKQDGYSGKLDSLDDIQIEVNGFEIKHVKAHKDDRKDNEGINQKKDMNEGSNKAETLLKHATEQKQARLNINDIDKRTGNKFIIEDCCSTESKKERDEEVLVWEEKEKGLDAAIKQAENENRQNEILETKENKKGSKVIVEKQEDKNKKVDSFGREEDGKRSKRLGEQKENEKKLVEVSELEEQIRLRETSECEENCGREREAYLLKERKMEEIPEKEVVETRLLGRKESRHKEAVQQNKARREEVVETFEDSQTQENDDNVVREAYSGEVNEKRFEESQEKRKKEESQKEATKCDENCEGNRETTEESYVTFVQGDRWEEIYWELQEEILLEEIGDKVYEDSNVRGLNDLNEANKQSQKDDYQGRGGSNDNTSGGGISVENFRRESTGGVFANERDHTVSSGAELNEKISAKAVTGNLRDDTNQVSELSEGELKDIKNPIKVESAQEPFSSDTKAGETAIFKEHMNIKATRMASPTRPQHLERKSAPEVGEVEKNSNQTCVPLNQNEKEKFASARLVKEDFDKGEEKVTTQPASVNPRKTNQQQNATATEGRQEKMGSTKSEDKRTEKLKREEELERERLRKLEEEREREREREKDRMAVDRATLEAQERSYAEARERAERAAMEKATADARQRAMTEARERLEKACAEARERSFGDKASVEARLRAERAAVERATAEARERAAEKAASSRYGGMRPSSSDRQYQNAGSSDSSRYQYSSGSYNNERSEGVEGESAQRCRARLERHRRTAERAAKALAEKNMRDLIAQREQAERNRLAEMLDADVKRWSNGKEGNLRALLSTLQYILGPDSGWQPIPLTEVITSAAVKKAYRKATLCVHPDKLQQRGASIQQKYICEKVFDLLKEAWNKFNSEER